MFNERLVAAVVFFVFFIQADLLALAQIACDNDNGNYTSDSAYSANLIITLSSLSTDIESDGFYNASTGEGADRVKVIAMCRGDVLLDECRDSVQKAGAGLLTSCPNQMRAINWEGSSMVRYSDASIYGLLSVLPTRFEMNPERVTSPEQFKGNLYTLLNDLRKKATTQVLGSQRKMAVWEANGPDSQKIFGLLQCTLDVSLEDCTTCLDRVIKKLL